MPGSLAGKLLCCFHANGSGALPAGEAGDGRRGSMNRGRDSDTAWGVGGPAALLRSRHANAGSGGSGEGPWA